MLYYGAIFTANFLKSLVRSVDKPVIVITDRHPAHGAKHTQNYVAQKPRLLGLNLLIHRNCARRKKSQKYPQNKRQLIYEKNRHTNKSVSPLIHADHTLQTLLLKKNTTNVV